VRLHILVAIWSPWSPSPWSPCGRHQAVHRKRRDKSISNMLESHPNPPYGARMMSPFHPSLKFPLKCSLRSPSSCSSKTNRQIDIKHVEKSSHPPYRARMMSPFHRIAENPAEMQLASTKGHSATAKLPVLEAVWVHIENANHRIVSESPSNSLVDIRRQRWRIVSASPAERCYGVNLGGRYPGLQTPLRPRFNTPCIVR